MPGSNIIQRLVRALELRVLRPDNALAQQSDVQKSLQNKLQLEQKHRQDEKLRLDHALQTQTFTLAVQQAPQQNFTEQQKQQQQKNIQLLDIANRVNNLIKHGHKLEDLMKAADQFMAEQYYIARAQGPKIKPARGEEPIVGLEDDSQNIGVQVDVDSDGYITASELEKFESFLVTKEDEKVEENKNEELAKKPKIRSIHRVIIYTDDSNFILNLVAGAEQLMDHVARLPEPAQVGPDAKSKMPTPFSMVPPPPYGDKN